MDNTSARKRELLYTEIHWYLHDSSLLELCEIVGMIRTMRLLAGAGCPTVEDLDLLTAGRDRIE